MRLSELLEKLDYTVLSGNENREITTLVYDSRQVIKDSVFVCIKGAISDGHKYIQDVVTKGAAAVIVEDDVNVEDYPDVAFIKTANNRQALAFMSANYFGNPASKIKTIGITGTKGKTTTSYMIKNVLDMAGYKTGLIGTIETIIGDEHIPSKNTTPESYKVQEYFAKMVEAGCQVVVMEVSSQGLMLDRVAGFEFDYGLLSNMGVDHIGKNEHKDFDDYLQSKAKLFKKCKVGILNADDEHLEALLENHTCAVETFGIKKDADYKADNISLFMNPGRLGVEFDLSGCMDMHVKVNIPGEFSVYNSLMALAICKHFNVSEETIANALENIKVKGRVELVPLKDKNYTMIIDYAHNAMSAQNLLETINAYNPKRVVVIFGAGGDRDRNRRFEMGEICSKYADFLVLTNDNPRTENPMSIINDIITGVEKGAASYVAIPDRREAIDYAMRNAKEGDVILLIGKGHEDYVEIMGKRYHFDEREVISELMYEEISVADILKVTNGKLIAGGDKAYIKGATTNSREVQAMDLFVPIIGERVDGHNFINMAFESGASVSLTSKEIQVENESKALVLVEDTLKAFQQIAAFQRSKFLVPLIGITGSVGKTTTKEMISAALSKELNILKTQGNLNSQIGLSLMMMRFNSNHEAAVIEMGVSENGEMARLADIAKPKYAIMTNIGMSHISQFKKKENTRKEKLNIINYFEEDSVLFVNGDDELLNAISMDDLVKGKIVRFGIGEHCDYRAVDIVSNDSDISFTVVFGNETYPVKLNVPGMHNVINALGAIAIADNMNLDVNKAIEGLGEYAPIKMRGEMIDKGGFKVIDDTYNASPDSIKSGIDVLVGIKDAKKKIAVLADVLELGEMSYTCHYEVGQYLATKEVHELVTVGNEAKAIAKAVVEAGSSMRVNSFDSNVEAIAYLKEAATQGSVLLVKGSRGMHMDEVVNAL